MLGFITCGGHQLTLQSQLCRQLQVAVVWAPTGLPEQAWWHRMSEKELDLLWEQRADEALSNVEQRQLSAIFLALTLSQPAHEI